MNTLEGWCSRRVHQRVQFTYLPFPSPTINLVIWWGSFPWSFCVASMTWSIGCWLVQFRGWWGCLMCRTIWLGRLRLLLELYCSWWGCRLWILGSRWLRGRLTRWRVSWLSWVGYPSTWPTTGHRSYRYEQGVNGIEQWRRLHIPYLIQFCEWWERMLSTWYSHICWWQWRGMFHCYQYRTLWIEVHRS